MFNPYLDTAPVTKVDRLYDRQNILREVLSGLLRHPRPINQQLIGLTASGKTSLLKSLLSLKETKYQNIVKTLGFESDQIGETLMVYLICSGLEEPGQFWHMLGYELTRALRNPLREVSLPLPPTSSFFDFRRNLSELFDLENRQFERVIFLFDEFEYIAEQLDLEVSRNLRALFDSFADSLAYVTATRRPLLSYYEKRSQSRQTQVNSTSSNSSSLHNVFDKTVYVGLLEGNRIAFIREPAMENGIAFSERDIDFALKLGGRHPSLTRMICSHIFEARTLHPQGELDFGKLEQEIRRDFRSLYQILKDELSDEQKLIIHETASGHIPDEKKDQELQILEDLGLIVKADKEFKLFTPLLKIYADWPDNPSSETSSERWGISLYPEEMTAVIRDRPIKLSPKEWRLFTFLFQHIGQVCTHEQLRRTIANGDGIVTQSNLNVAVRRLRDKVEENPSLPRLIHTVRGEGFKLEPMS